MPRTKEPESMDDDLNQSSQAFQSMPNLKHSPNFVKNQYVTEIPDDMAINEVFHTLSNHDSSAFILVKRGHPVKYVNGQDLAKLLIERLDSKSQKINRKNISGKPIWEILKEIPEASINIETVKSEEVVGKLETRSKTVFAVEESGRRIGWFLNKELLQTINTPTPIFICERNHENLDFNDGFCSFCPAPIVKLRSN